MFEAKGMNENFLKDIECKAKRETEGTPAWREGEKEEWSREVDPSAAPDPGPAGPSLMSTLCLSLLHSELAQSCPPLRT